MNAIENRQELKEKPEPFLTKACEAESPKDCEEAERNIRLALFCQGKLRPDVRDAKQYVRKEHRSTTKHYRLHASTVVGDAGQLAENATEKAQTPLGFGLTRSKKNQKSRRCKMIPPNKSEVSFEKTFYDGKDVTVESMNLKQVRVIDLKSFDCCLAKCLRVQGYKDPKGSWCSFQRPITVKALRILQAIQLNPGVGLDKETLSSLTGIHELPVPGFLPPRVWLLRAAFGESKETQRLICTPDDGPFWLMWPQEFTWIWVDLIRPEHKT